MIQINLCFFQLIDYIKARISNHFHLLSFWFNTKSEKGSGHMLIRIISCWVYVYCLCQRTCCTFLFFFMSCSAKKNKWYWTSHSGMSKSDQKTSFRKEKPLRFFSVFVICITAKQFETVTMFFGFSPWCSVFCYRSWVMLVSF